MMKLAVQAKVLPDFQNVFTRGRITEGGVLRNERDTPRDPGKDNPGRDGHDKGGEVDYKVELLCRTFVGDTDARPLAGSQVFWESPDIWVVGPSGPDLPQAGVVNQVFVHVWNLGLLESTATFVELYWCNPSVGVNAAQSHFIGVQTLSLGAQDDAVVSFNWTPTFENGGHECLVAQVYNPLHDPVVAPFNPVVDRHVAQRNVTVLMTQAGKKIDYQFFAANFSQRTATSQLSLEPILHDDLSTLAQATGQTFFLSAPGTTALLAEPTVRPVTVSRDITHTAMQVFRETLEPAPHPAMKQLMQHQLVHGEHLERERASANTYAAKVDVKQWSHDTLHVAPLQEAALTLQVATAKDSPQGSVQAYRVIERVGERITGGVTVLVQVE